MRGFPRAPDPMPGGGPSRVPAPPCTPVLRVPVLSGLRAREAVLPRRALSESPRACGVLWDCPSSSAPARGPALIPARTPVGMLFRCSGPRRTGRVLAPFQVTLQVRAPRAVSARSRAPVTRRPARRWSPCDGDRAAQRSCRGPAVAPHRYHHPSHFRFSRSAAPSRRAQRGRVQNQAYQPPSTTPARANFLDKARCMARLRDTHAHCNSFNPPEKRWGHRRGRGVGRAHVVPRPPPFLRPSAGPQRRSMGAPSSAHLPRGELKHPPIGCSLGERFSSGLRSTVVLTQNAIAQGRDSSCSPSIGSVELTTEWPSEPRSKDLEAVSGEVKWAAGSSSGFGPGLPRKSRDVARAR